VNLGGRSVVACGDDGDGVSSGWRRWGVTSILTVLGAEQNAKPGSTERSPPQRQQIRTNAMHKAATIMSLVLGTLLIGGALLIQEPPAPPAGYGKHISLKQVKEPAEAPLLARAKGTTSFMAIAAVFPSRDFAYCEKTEITQHASVNIAMHQATPAATFRCPIQSLEERTGAGGADLGRRRGLASGRDCSWRDFGRCHVETASFGLDGGAAEPLGCIGSRFA